MNIIKVQSQCTRLAFLLLLLLFISFWMFILKLRASKQLSWGVFICAGAESKLVSQARFSNRALRINIITTNRLSMYVPQL